MVGREMEQEETIMVCNECDRPLIWTFAFPYCEYYCLSCGAKGGMFGTGHKAELTNELKKELTTIKRRWGQVKRWLVEAKYFRVDCGKCKDHSEYHYQHLTDLEKTKAEWARNKLKDWATA